MENPSVTSGGDFICHYNGFVSFVCERQAKHLKSFPRPRFIVWFFFLTLIFTFLNKTIPWVLEEQKTPVCEQRK